MNTEALFINQDSISSIAGRKEHIYPIHHIAIDGGILNILACSEIDNAAGYWDYLLRFGGKLRYEYDTQKGLDSMHRLGFELYYNPKFLSLNNGYQIASAFFWLWGEIWG